MPPTMIVTWGRPLAASPFSALASLLRQPASDEAATAETRAAAASRRVCCCMVVLLHGQGPSGGVGESGAGGASERGGLAAGRRPPGGQTDLQLGDQPLGDEGEHGRDEHPGVDAGGVEVALRVV